MKKEKGSVCLSFDDGRGDNRYIAEKILLPMNIPATFNITTGYVDGSCGPADRPSIKKPMTIDDVRWIAEHNIFEIAMHGDEHKNTLERQNPISPYIIHIFLYTLIFRHKKYMKIGFLVFHVFQALKIQRF